MQAETGRTVEAIAAIARTIEELNANTAQVAAASEEQAAATQEIGRAVAEAAAGTQEASRSAVGVKQGAERTGGAAQDLAGRPPNSPSSPNGCAGRWTGSWPRSAPRDRSAGLSAPPAPDRGLIPTGPMSGRRYRGPRPRER
jgi:hypothetical protein